MKKLFLCLICLFFIFGSQGPSDPTLTDGALYDVAFSNSDSVKTADNKYATATFTSDDAAQSFVSGVEAYAYGFSVPGGATNIWLQASMLHKHSAEQGIVDVQVASSFDTYIGSSFQITSDDNDGDGSNHTITTQAASFVAFNSETGLTLTPSDVNAVQFGIDVRVVIANADTFKIDHITLTVNYTTASTTKHRIIGYGEGKTETQWLSQWTVKADGTITNEVWEKE